MKPYKVLHFVYGGGSGATKKAEEIALGNSEGKLFEPLIVYNQDTRISKRVINNNISFKKVSFSSKSDLVNRLIDIINEFSPDIVISHGYKEHIYGRFAAARVKVPINIMVEHNTQPYIFTYFILSHLLSHNTDRIVCVSNAVKNNLVRLFFNKKKMDVIYNGFYVEDFLNYKPLNQRLPGIVMVARFCSQKDHETMVRALKIIKDRGIECPIYFVGTGMDKHVDRIKKLCQELELSDMVFFLGRRKDVPDLLAKYQLFVLSTHYEGLSGVVMEAMAAGNVIIATDAPGVSELVEDGKVGFLVPPRSPKILADRIISVLQEPEEYQEIVKSAQKYTLENFKVKRMVKKYEKLFYEEIEKKGLLKRVMLDE